MILLGTVLRTTAEDRAIWKTGVGTFHQATTLSKQLAAVWGFADPSSVKAAPASPRVWVDFPSATYYCSGSRRYGKTSNGKFTTEENARLSQYEPALHKPCPSEPALKVSPAPASLAQTRSSR